MLDLTKYSDGYPSWYRTLVVAWFVVAAGIMVLGVYVKKNESKADAPKQSEKPAGVPVSGDQIGPVNSPSAAVIQTAPQVADVSAPGATVIQAAPFSTVINRPKLSEEETKQIADAVHAPRPVPPAPTITEKDIQLTALLMPSWDYPDKTKIGGIVFDRRSFDVRFDVTVQNLTIRNLDLSMVLNSSGMRRAFIDEIAQLSSFPDVTFFVAGQVPAMILDFEGDDQKSYQVPTSGKAAADVWRMRCRELIPNTTLRVIMKAMFLGGPDNERPKTLHIRGTFELSRPGGDVWRYKVDRIMPLPSLGPTNTLDR